ncbi:MOSC domain-containing protein [Urechidicola sp. KH5]
MKVVATNIGERKTVVWKNKTVETGIYKFPTLEPIVLGEKDVVGDAVIDRKHHGGTEQAVYAYSASHYNYFKELHPDLDWQYGMFGENLTLEVLEETELTVGSTYSLGECIVEVSKPRQPCYKLGIRFGTQKIVKQFWNSTKSGVYFKVLQGGRVQVGDQLVLIEKKFSTPTIAEVYDSKK